jgi:hypothetical protein
MRSRHPAKTVNVLLECTPLGRQENWQPFLLERIVTGEWGVGRRGVLKSDMGGRMPAAVLIVILFNF